ncbi:MAG: 2OG-Fe(II) oxygenase [Alphaproteobacteria bacterium]
MTDRLLGGVSGSGGEAASPVRGFSFDIDGLADRLHGVGWAVLPRAVDPDLCAALRRTALGEWSRGGFRTGGIGRDRRRQSATRRTAIRWLDGAAPAEAEYLAAMEALRLGLNRRLFLGLFEFESHYAVYPPGAFYATHVDALRGGNNRQVSTVLFLEPGWDAVDGGLLEIDAPDGASVASVLPEAGTLVCFLSEVFPHRVTPTRRLRVSLPGWFRCNASASDRAIPPD